MEKLWDSIFLIYNKVNNNIEVVIENINNWYMIYLSFMGFFCFVLYRIKMLDVIKGIFRYKKSKYFLVVNFVVLGMIFFRVSYIL